MKNIIIFCIVCVNLFLAACTNKKPAENAAKEEVQQTEDVDKVHLTQEQIVNAGIVIDSVRQKEMHQILRVNGVIDVAPQNVVSITFPLGGYIKTMNMLPGMNVKKGQVLAVLEDPQYVQLQQDYLIAKTKLGFLQTDFIRQKELNETKANSDKVFQQAQTDFESQKVLVRALFEKLAFININANKLTQNNISPRAYIYAPISGYLSKVNVNKGRYVNPTDVLFELVNHEDLHLNLTVFEKDVLYVRPGQKVVCYSNNNEEKYYGTITVVNRNINEERSSEVHCHFDRYYKNISPGMFMNAEIQLNNIKVDAVPNEAIVRWENKYYVFAADANNNFEMMQVEPGISNGGYTELKQPIPATRIVTKNAYNILMKMKNSAEEE